MRSKRSLLQSLNSGKACRRWSGLERYGRALHSCQGYTLIELMVVVAILGTLASIAVPTYFAYVNKARVVRAIADIKTISRAIDTYNMEKDAYPTTLNDVGYGSLRDPWGRPYAYLNISTAQGKGALRKDRFLVPINSDYDLYSLGQDGKSVSPLTAKASRDDIIRANDGGYIGLAALY